MLLALTIIVTFGVLDMYHGSIYCALLRQYITPLRSTKELSHNSSSLSDTVSLQNCFVGSVHSSAVVYTLGVRFQSNLTVKKSSQITFIPGGELLILAKHYCKSTSYGRRQQKTLDSASASDTWHVPTALLSLVGCSIRLQVACTQCGTWGYSTTV